MFHCIRFILFAGVCVGCQSPEASKQVQSDQPPSFRQVDSNIDVYIGGQPDGYGPLQEMGFRSVIDVDATAPRTRFPSSLTVVHVPLRYGGISGEEANVLASAVGSMERPIYIHCHHGTNRAPTAAAVGLVGTGEWVPDRGMQLLEQAGTDPSFAGLYASVATSVEIPVDKWMPLPSSRHESDSFSVLMAGIDEGWAALAFDLEGSRPSSETATQAAELVDMLRSAFDADARMEEGAFHGHAMQSISHATALEHALRGDRFDQVNDLVDALNATCMSCHRQYRD